MSQVAKYACFTADTPVLMADGSSKPIADVSVGDVVSGLNPDTGECEPAVVEATFVHEQVATWEVSTDQGSVTTTAVHPFYVDGAGWVEAAELRAGDRLRTPDGTWVSVTTVEATGETQRVFNLTVAGLHNYHVATSDGTHILTHNSSPGGDCALSSRSAAFRQAKRDMGIPMNEVPEVRHVALRDPSANGTFIRNPDGSPVYSREYNFTGPGHEPVTIQEHSLGHQFGENGIGDQGPHFNVRPLGATHGTPSGRNGASIPEHYPFNGADHG